MIMALNLPHNHYYYPNNTINDGDLCEDLYI